MDIVLRWQWMKLIGSCQNTTVSTIPLSENRVFYLKYLWQTDSERGIVWNDPEWNQIRFTQ